MSHRTAAETILSPERAALLARYRAGDLTWTAYAALDAQATGTPAARFPAHTWDLPCPRCIAVAGQDCRALTNPARASSVVHKERVAAFLALRA